MAEVVLWHIEVSHYNEKARWALDHKGVPHRRRAPMPGLLHPFVGLVKARQPFLPVVEIDGRAIGDSTRIIAELERRWPDPPLYPSDPDERRRALELEDWIDEALAPEIRRMVFFELSKDPARSEDGLRRLGGLPLPGRAASLMVRGVARRYGGSEKALGTARERIRSACERLGTEIGPSGFLAGDAFSVADLTAASILHPIVRPEQFQYVYPDYPPPLEAFIASLPAEPLDWVRGLWRDHRPPSAEVAGSTRRAA